MENFLIYLIKTSALLTIFYLCYFLFLKKETSFNLNRRYLLVGLITSAILPAIYFTRKVYVKASPHSLNFVTDTSEVSQFPVEVFIDWWQISGIIYLIITGFFLLRLAIQLTSVIKIINSHNFQNKSGLKYLEITENQLPFSFFNYIIFNPKKHTNKDLALILEHEKVHARQLHSADILFTNFMTCILWFNPFAWLYKKTVEQNLEFIADRETVKNTAEIKDYQHALVKVSIADLKPALTNHFYQSFIKKRILMLNKKSSTQSPAWKLSLIIPLLLTFMFFFNVDTEAQIVQPEENQQMTESTKAIKIEEIIKSEEEPNVSEKTKESFTTISEKTLHPVKTSAIHQNRVPDLMNNPLYILNGKKFKSTQLKNKYIGLKSKFEVIVGEVAINRFGKDAKNGVVIVPNADIIRDFNNEMKTLKKQNKYNGKYIMVGESGKPNFININTNKPAAKTKSIEFISAGDTPVVNSEKSKVKIISQEGEPLYIVDEVIMEDSFDVNTIQPEDISSINVLKGENAVKEYGKKAKNGVIIIKTKKNTIENNASIFLIKNSFNNNQIESLKKEVEEKTGYILILKNIERNNNIITNIEVKFYNKNNSVESAYNNPDGIPTIKVGIKKGGGLIISSSN